jgi:hypothetical protein
MTESTHFARECSSPWPVSALADAWLACQAGDDVHRAKDVVARPAALPTRSRQGADKQRVATDCKYPLCESALALGR